MVGVELVGGAFLSAAFQVALERLASADFKHYLRGKKGIEGLLKKLEITLLSVKQVLEDAEEKQYANSNMKRWLDELKDAVYVADDLLDEVACEATRQKLEAQSQTATAKVRGFFTSLINQFDSQIEVRIQQVLHDLEFLAKKKNEFGLKEGSGGARFRGKMSYRLPSTSLLGETTIYGRDGDKEEIIKFLVSDSDARGRRVSVICIVGMGGLGKTTLAQLVYNHPGMQQQFQLKAWLCVAEDFDVERLTKTILSALGCSTTGNEDLNQLQLKLKDIFMERKFLLVLDDVWSQDPTLWETLQAPFLYGASGSKIVITTRNKEVASVMQAKVQPLQLLEKEDSWKLFAKYAFNDEDATTNTNLEPLGRKIVDKCKGLPLAIKSLGALVSRELSEQRWGEILESDIWQLLDDKSNIIPALRLSYHYLPSHLKRCFAFCSIYPKDYPIYKDTMVQLWMAEGLLDGQKGAKSAEELGDEFFNDLESRSFFERRDSRYFVMHNLVNDLAKSVSGEFCVRIEEDKIPYIPTKARYISYYQRIQYISGNAQHIRQSNQLHMIMQFNTFLNYKDYEFKASVLSRLKYLRILSLTGCANIIELNDDIRNLKHLRYLDLSRTKIERLPDSICTLHNLQTLILINCFFLVELSPNIHQLISLRHLSLFGSKINKLPYSICRLRNLRTLNLASCACLDELPRDFHKLTNLRDLDLLGTKIREIPKYLGMLKYLQKLDAIYVGKCSGSSIKELGTLNKLERRLSISQLENISDAMDAKEAKMREKECLDILELEWKEHEDSKNERSVLEAFQPHVNLKELHITNYSGSSFVNWFNALYLPNLVTLKLSGCKYCFSLPPLGQLPSLKGLYICGLEGIKKIGIEFYGNNSLSAAFRSLEYLEFIRMSEWEEWVQFEGECFLCLRELHLEMCPRLTKSLPLYLTSLRSLKIDVCQELEPSLPKAVTMTYGGMEESWPKECWMQQILVTNPNLEQLYLNACPKLVPFPTFEIAAPKFKYLSIGKRRQDESLPENMQAHFPIRSLRLRNCPHLEYLSLSNCPELESFHKEGLPSRLFYLEIKHCPKLIACHKEWGLCSLRSLQKLIVGGDFENMESFPDESFLPSNLSDLSFEGCSNLKTINYKGLLHLTSLNILKIGDCPSLQCLPEQILPNVKNLSIWGDCPTLKQRYQEENGQDWHKISHIPHVRID